MINDNKIKIIKAYSINYRRNYGKEKKTRISIYESEL